MKDETKILSKLSFRFPKILDFDKNLSDSINFDLLRFSVTKICKRMT